MISTLRQGRVPLTLYTSYHRYSPEQKLISEHDHQQLAEASHAREAERAELIMKEYAYKARNFLAAQARAQAAGGEA